MISTSTEKTTLKKDHSLSGKVAWRSPSNIALIKYWGKRTVQIPENASISFTLSEAHTETIVSYQPRKDQELWVSFLFEGKEEPSFAQRITKYFESLLDHLPFLNELSFQIESSNSFPHSSGIASSASSMSALAMCLCDIGNEISNNGNNSFLQKASFLARLGSGSASRSVFPTLAVWGETSFVSGSSNEYAVPYTEVAEVFKSFHDDVLIVSEEKKSVSSSQGHALMENNLFANSRYKQADQNMRLLLTTMKEGNLMEFGKIVEDEALTLHALMMCSDPSFILMKPATLEVIERIRQFRKETALPIFFTLDAGPNVHILYPNKIETEAKKFINNELSEFAKDGRIITDQVGAGPVKIL